MRRDRVLLLLALAFMSPLLRVGQRPQLLYQIYTAIVLATFSRFCQAVLEAWGLYPNFR